MLTCIVPPSGTRCWNGRGISRAGSVRFNSNVRHQRDIKERSTEADCVAPSAFTYTDAEGKSQAIKVPDIASANTIAELASAENFAALAKYEPCKFGAGEGSLLPSVLFLEKLFNTAMTIRILIISLSRQSS